MCLFQRHITNQNEFSFWAFGKAEKLIRTKSTIKSPETTLLLNELATENWKNDPELAWLALILRENVKNNPDEDNEDEGDSEQWDLCQCMENDIVIHFPKR